MNLANPVTIQPPQAEARVLELLGSDVKVGLEKLFVPPAPPVRK